jgi:hypothetical protein
MQELSLIEFLKKEIHFFREILSTYVAEEMAYKSSSPFQINDLNYFRQSLLQELKTLRSGTFKPFNKQDEVEFSLLCILKDQLESLVDQVKSQQSRNKSLIFICAPEIAQASHKKLQVEILDDEE